MFWGVGRLWEVWFVLGVGGVLGEGVVEWYIKPLELEQQHEL